MSEPLRILTVANVLPDPNSGAAGTVWATNVALRELGHQVDEIWSDRLGPRRIRHGNLHSLLEQPRLYRREVRKALSSKRYDVVQLSQPQAWLAMKWLKQSGFQGVVVNRSHGLELRVDAVLPEWHRKLGVPESRFPNSLATPLLRRMLQKQWHETVRWADRVVLTNDVDREFLQQRTGVSSAKAVTIHHGVPDPFLTTPPREMSEGRLKRLLYVGQFSFIKGYHVLVDTLNQLLNKRQDLTMTWVTGEAGHSQIRELLDPAIQDRVVLRGWSDQAGLIDVYDDHGIFLFPSLFEGAGKAALEAMSRGLCVITTDTGGMRDYLADTDRGILIPVGNAGQFAAAAENLLDNVGRAQQMSYEARQYATSKTWIRCAENYDEMYRSVLQSDATVKTSLKESFA